MKMLNRIRVAGVVSLLLAITPALANQDINRLDNRIYRCDQVFKSADNVSAILVLGSSKITGGEISAQDGSINVVNINPMNGLCYPAKDPLMGTSSGIGSPWTRLGNKLIDNHSYEGVLLVPVISRSNSIADWKQDGKIFNRLKHLISSLTSQGIKIDSVVWQHEQNKDPAVQQKEDYVAGFNDFLKGLRATGVDAPVYIAKVGVCPGHTDSPFYAAQKDLAQPSANVLEGPDLSSLASEDFIAGSCLLNKEGLDAYVSSWLHLLKK